MRRADEISGGTLVARRVRLGTLSREPLLLVLVVLREQLIELRVALDLVGAVCSLL